MRAVFVDDYDTDVIESLTLHSSAEDNTGYISINAKMCERSLVRDEPY